MADEVSIEFAFPANHAEAINGLLYLNGGGWTQIHRQTGGTGGLPSTPMGIAVGLRVPWNALYGPHVVSVRIDPDIEETPTESVYFGAVEIAVGPPPFIAEQADQHVMLSFPAQVIFPGPGAYVLKAQVVGGTEVKQWKFWVRDITTR